MTCEPTLLFNRPKKMKSNRRAWVLLCSKKSDPLSLEKLSLIIAFALINFFGAICISLQAPFFPQEAEDKGASPEQYALVFAAFQFSMLIFSPLCSTFIPVVGSKTMTRCGVLVTSLSCIGFGFIKMIDDTTAFIATAILIRIIEGFGEAQFFVSLFSILSQEFQDSVALMFAFFTTCWSVGLMLGPTIGGFLYDAGGFTLPFVTTGGCLFIVAIVSCFILRNHVDLDPDEEITQLNYLIFKLIKYPGVITSCLGVFSAAFSIGFIQTTLEQHLEVFEVSSGTVGLLFSLSSVFYIMGSPFWGWLCDRGIRPHFCMLMGSIIYCVAFFLIGPPPFLPMRNLLWVNVICLALIGLALSCHFVSGFTGVQRETLKQGYPRDLNSYSASSGLWSSSTSLGACLGASITGVLYQNLGFANSSLVIVGLHLIVFVVILVYLIFSQGFVHYKSGLGERTPLISSFTSSTSSCVTSNETEPVFNEEVF